MPYHNFNTYNDDIEQYSSFITENDPKCILDDKYNEAYINFYN